MPSAIAAGRRLLLFALPEPDDLQQRSKTRTLANGLVCRVDLHAKHTAGARAFPDCILERLERTIAITDECVDLPQIFEAESCTVDEP